ncbi:uncharacterized protein LOC133910799 [Phragmites australis]|uniref:uncharacterized protein LOC133910799 n=1 Tax=Phragmites australis TaxID=29695 RepID=UPI002D797FBD|nr:uncharacterized protein LOC133910799 [Phragmites australis]
MAGAREPSQRDNDTQDQTKYYRVVGAVSVAPTAERCRGELGYVLARAHWGKGVATAAVRRALGAVFAEVGRLARVEAPVDVDNPASQRVAEKAGFRREGVLRGHGLVQLPLLRPSPRVILGSMPPCISTQLQIRDRSI